MPACPLSASPGPCHFLGGKWCQEGGQSRYTAPPVILGYMQKLLQELGWGAQVVDYLDVSASPRWEGFNAAALLALCVMCLERKRREKTHKNRNSW